MDAWRHDALGTLVGAPVAAPQRDAVRVVGSDSKDAGDRSGKRVACAALIAGSGHNQDIARGRSLQGFAEIGGECEEIRLLRSADVDDVGVLIERARDAGSQFFLRADLVDLRGCRPEDRNGGKRAQRRDAWNNGVARSRND